ncbi:MAG TPA: MFS transporter [Stellaceae bacterium]|nr:MFS transporter [Stellaceae bacterium]
MAGEWTGKASGVVVAGLVGSALGAGPVIFYSLPLLMRPVTQEFHWSLADFSVVQGIASITVAIVSPFLGYLTDRWGARAIMLPGILAFGIANFLLSLLNGSLSELYVFWFLVGLSAAFVGPVAYSKLISAWFYRRRGLALGVSLGVGGGIGGALMPLVVGPIILNHGWRAAYWTMSGAIIVICLPVAFFLLREPAGWRQREKAALPTDAVGMTAAEARKTRNFWLLAIAQFLGAIAVLGVLAHSVNLLAGRGFSPSIGIAVLSAAGLTSIFGRIISGFFLDRIDSPRVSLIFFLAPLIAVLLLQYGGSPPLVILGGVILGLGLGAEGEIVSYFISRYFGLRSLAEIYSYTYGIFVIGAGMGPFIFGASFDSHHSYDQILLIAEIGMAVSIVLMALLGPYVFPAIKDMAVADGATGQK